MKDLLYHLFVPHHRNNHRAKLLHNSSISILLICLLFLNFFASFIKHITPDVLGISYNISDTELLVATNKVRQENNLPPLNLNSQLTSAASMKAKDMFEKNYWAHFAPDGTTPWSFIRSAGYTYIYAGENLAKGFTSSQDVVNAWMASPSHRDNILSNKYNDIGFAIQEGQLLGEDTILVVEIFGTSEASNKASKEIAYTQPQVTPAQEIPSAGTSGLLTQQKVTVSPTIQPTVQPTLQPTIQPTKQPQQALKSNVAYNTLGQVQSSKVNRNPLINLLSVSKNTLLLIFPVMMITLIIDLVIVERKKIPRLVGHNLDHFMLIFMFVLYLILQQNGVII